MIPTRDGAVREVTIPQAASRRRGLVAAVAAAGLLAGIALGSLGTATYVAESTVVLVDPQLDGATATATPSPEIFVNGQVAVFGLTDLHESAAQIATAELRTTALIEANAVTEVGTGPSTRVFATGAVETPSFGVDADGAVGPAEGTTGPVIDADGTVTDRAGVVPADESGPVRLDEGDQAVLRPDGLLALHSVSGTVDVVTPEGQVVRRVGAVLADGLATADEVEAGEDASEGTSPLAELGLSLNERGSVIVAGEGPWNVELRSNGRAVVIDDAGNEVRRPDTGTVVGTTAVDLLLDEAQVVSVADDEVVVIDGAGEIVITDRAGAVVAASPDAPVTSDLEDLVVEPITSDQFDAGLTVASSPDSYVLQIAYRDTEPQRSIIGVNAAVDAYEELQQSSVSSEQAAALAVADDTIARLTDNLVGIESRLTELRIDSGAAGLIDQQYADVLARISQVGETLLVSSGAAADTQVARLQQLLVQLDAIEAVSRLEVLQPEIAEATDERDQVRQRLAQLQIERDALLIETRNANRTISIESPAIDATEAAGLGSARLALVGALLGLAVGAALAYLVESRRPARIESALDAEQLLGAPLLAEVPDFRHERIDDYVPVISRSDTYAAEAFRIAAAAVQIRARAEKVTIVGIVSAGVGAGKTAVSANLAVAIAQGARRVLVVDSDLEGRGLSTVLRRESVAADDGQPGVADYLRGERAFADVIQRVTLPDGTGLDLVGAGTDPETARTAVDANMWTRFFSEARRSNYDLVLVDIAPLLAVAYASRIVSEVQGVMVVAPNGTPLEEQRDLRDRLGFVSAKLLGFVFNRSALRRDRTASVAITDPTRQRQFGLQRTGQRIADVFNRGDDRGPGDPDDHNGMNGSESREPDRTT